MDLLKRTVLTMGFVLAVILIIQLPFESIDRTLETFQNASFIVKYSVVFVLSAAPIVEIVGVIPASISLGFNPVFVFMSSVFGNLSAVYVIGLVYYVGPRNYVNDLISKYISGEFRGQFNKYGVIGISLICPITVGTRITTLGMLICGGNFKNVMLWMSVSIMLWGCIVTVISYTGAIYLL